MSIRAGHVRVARRVLSNFAKFISRRPTMVPNRTKLRLHTEDIRSNTLLTKRYGPRVRFASVLTNVQIDPDSVMDEPLCIRCMRCVEHCPVRAIDGGAYPEHLIDKGLCTDHNASLGRRGISPCGNCIRVCPVGEDRAIHGRSDMKIYETSGPLESSWKHVRSYGSK